MGARAEMALKFFIVLLGLIYSVNLSQIVLADAAPYSGLSSALPGANDSQSPLVREVSQAHAEQVAYMEKQIAELVLQLKALSSGDPQRDLVASKLKQQQQLLKDTRIKFRDLLLCILNEEAKPNGTLPENRDINLITCVGTTLAPNATADPSQEVPRP